MSLQQNETVELGQTKVTRVKSTVFVVPNIGASIAVVIFDAQQKIGGITHVLLPDSSLRDPLSQENLSKYADVAIPILLDAYLEEGGQIASTTVSLIGGAQLFNFGGGSGNLLNIGSRNATAIKLALAHYGLAVEKTDLGANKARSLRFILANGIIYVKIPGHDERPMS